jgi:uncharacterized membrane protein YjjB (DUF3815 family)
LIVELLFEDGIVGTALLMMFFSILLRRSRSNFGTSGLVAMCSALVSIFFMSSWQSEMFALAVAIFTSHPLGLAENRERLGIVNQ